MGADVSTVKGIRGIFWYMLGIVPSPVIFVPERSCASFLGFFTWVDTAPSVVISVEHKVGAVLAAAVWIGSFFDALGSGGNNSSVYDDVVVFV